MAARWTAAWRSFAGKPRPTPSGCAPTIFRHSVSRQGRCQLTRTAYGVVHIDRDSAVAGPARKRCSISFALCEQARRTWAYLRFSVGAKGSDTDVAEPLLPEKMDGFVPAQAK